MSITAKQMKKTNSFINDIELIVKEQLAIIDNKLLKSTRCWGKNMIIHELSITYILVGVEKKDLQKVVYTEIIKSLENRGFETALKLTNESAFLYIRWSSEFNSEEIEEMNKLLSIKCLKQNEKIEQFKNWSKS